MEKLNNYSEEILEKNSIKEKTLEVLRWLILCGLITSPSFAKSLDSDIQDTNLSTPSETDLDIPTKTEANALFLENSLKEQGLFERTEKHIKPVIVLATENSINTKFSGENENIDEQILIEEELESIIKDGKILVAERDPNVLKQIIKEVRFEATGLVKENERVKLGKWVPADYYVLFASLEDGSLKNQIIDMKDGKSYFVYAESMNDLIEKTKKAVEELNN